MIDEIRFVEKYLRKAHEFPMAHKLNQSDIFCTKFSEDNLFYRCRIMLGLDDGASLVTVSYIDYGNTEETSKSEIRSLPDQIKNTRPLTIELKTGFDEDSEENRFILEQTLYSEGLALLVQDDFIQVIF